MRNDRRKLGGSARALLLGTSAAMLAASAWAGCGGSDDDGSTGNQGGGSGTTTGTGTTSTTTTTTTTSGTGTGGGEVCPGATLCNGVCTNTGFDPLNCGACGNACAENELCNKGACASTCGGGTTLCGEDCVDVDLDPANCGACGNACADGEVCSGGQCGLTCVGGTTSCGGKCVDTQTDPANCGGCETACEQGQLCSAGICALECFGGTTDCDGKCVDTQADAANCGACGTVCAPGEVCSAGACGIQCAGGTTLCGNKCVDTQTDAANCGGCGTVCGAGEVCSAGACGIQCVGGTTLCGGKCVDTQGDPANCGACGTVCAAGEVCSAGACGLQCGGGSTKCGNKCVDTQTDPANCGACGTMCAAGEVCSQGKCTGVCGGGLVQCGNKCVDTQTDPANCGACGKACAGGDACVNGACAVCDSAVTDCDKDGWLAAEGDCCDKPGLCGSEPVKVNPGAIEVVGNSVDDNCNGKTDLFDTADTVACDAGLASNSANAVDYAKAIGICRQTVENPPLKKDKTWGLIDAKILRADGSALGDGRARSIRSGFGGVSPATTQGQALVVLSSGIAADAKQANPGPNGGAPAGGNVSTMHQPSSSVPIGSGGQQYSVKDWYATPNPPLKPANGLPDSPGCNASNSANAIDSVMLVFRLRAPTNAKAFSFNSYFFSAEYPEYVCTSFNDQFIALIDTPSGIPSPIPNPVDKNLMTYTSGGQQWPIGINIAKGTSLFSVCQTQAQNPQCWDKDVSVSSCSLGVAQLSGTGFEKPQNTNCTIGGGTFWLTTAGNVNPGEIVELRIGIWDVGDSVFDSLALIDGFQWLSSATLPGTGN